MRADGRFGGQQERGGPVGHLAGHGGGDLAALADGLEGGHLLQRRVGARALVGGEGGIRDDLVGERPGSLRGERALVTGEREVLHVGAADVPPVGDELGTVELADLGVAVARRPAVTAEGMPEALRRADRGGAPDRHEAHHLDAAREHQILLSRKDPVCREAHRLLRRAALAVDGRAGDGLGQTGAEPAGAGDVRGLRADLVDAPPDDVVDR